MSRFADISENKEEFLQTLRALLSPLSESERNDAILYYTEYFNDAGEENEKSVLLQLGSPESVAEKILEENGYLTEEENNIQEENTDSAAAEPVPEQNNANSQKEDPPFYKNPSTVILIIVLAILTFPAWASVLGVIVSIAAAFLAILAGMIGVAVALMASGIVAVVVGAMMLAEALFDGLLTLGVGFILFGIGLFIVPLFVKICVTVIPAIIKGLINLCKIPFRKKAEL